VSRKASVVKVTRLVKASPLDVRLMGQFIVGLGLSRMPAPELPTQGPQSVRIFLQIAMITQPMQ
jgi:hypothetical protein